GAQLSYIRRVRSEFQDIQYRDENRIKNYWDEMKSSLEEIEYILGEPSSNGLSSVIDSFWNSWQELSTNPESMSVRGSLKEHAQSLISFLAHIRGELILQREQLNKDLEIQVNTINDIATQIGALNEEIKKAYIRGQSPNDLLDKRDLLLDKLSGLVNFDVRINEVGEAIISGIKSMVPALVILTLAWTIGSVIKLSPEEGGLGLSKFLSELVISGGFPIWALPVVVFLVASAISFSTGTSWGTFSIMIPITMPIAIALAEKSGASLMNTSLVAVGAAIGGAIFGDHCSPISDTTILSSSGAGCPHLEHVATQIPYAIFVMIVSAVGYLIAGIFENPIAGLFSALIVFFIAYEIVKKIWKTKEI
ncbi:MAG: FlgK family flagellar hook-associated protein, partial [Fervidobacterium sp.]